MFRSFADLDELTLPEYEALASYDPAGGMEGESAAEIREKIEARAKLTPRQKLERWL